MPKVGIMAAACIYSCKYALGVIVALGFPPPPSILFLMLSVYFPFRSLMLGAKLALALRPRIVLPCNYV